MKIALLGYGKMGQIIEQFALTRGHEIILKINRENQSELTVSNLQKADVVIDFSTPEVVLKHIDLCFEAGIPQIIGTTGWYTELQNVKNKCLESNNTLLFGSNFSIGVNLFFYINRKVAELMNAYPAYQVQVEEIHHVKKLDAPSGTAITIAEDIIAQTDHKSEWVNELIGATDENVNPTEKQLLIRSVREDMVPGTHVVTYNSEIDAIELKHTAHNRNGFALGAVIAAEWVVNKKGFFEVKEMFDFNNQK